MAMKMRRGGLLGEEVGVRERGSEVGTGGGEEEKEAGTVQFMCIYDDVIVTEDRRYK